jgi:glycosyltransferase A (GT-A) superfamily protein (DUF2064 family)
VKEEEIAKVRKELAAALGQASAATAVRERLAAALEEVGAVHVSSS